MGLQKSVRFGLDRLLLNGIIKPMATPKTTPKAKISMEDYNKNKAVREKTKLKLHFPLLVKVLLILPVIYLVFLLVYFVATARKIPEH